MNEPLRVLFVEDSADDATLLKHALKKGGYTLHSQRVQTALDMASSLKTETWDIIFSDFSMPNFDAFDALAVLKNSKLDIPFIIVSGNIGEETAVAAMKAGAHDYFLKGKLLRLIPTIQRELNEAKARKQSLEV